MNKQTRKLFIVIETVKTLDKLKRYDVDGVDFKAVNEYGSTLAHCYALNENATIEGFKYLFDKGVDFKAVNEFGCTLAHYYAYNENAILEGFKYLFEKEVDFKAVTECGDTIAHYYAKNPNATLEGFKYLFDKGVDFKAKNGSGCTIADVYIGKCERIEKEPSKEILEFLKEQKLQNNIESQSIEAKYLSMKDWIAIYRNDIITGKNLSRTIDDSNNTHIMYASLYGQLDIIKNVIDNDTERTCKDFLINEVNNRKESAMTFAILSGHLEIVQYFLRFDVDITADMVALAGEYRRIDILKEIIPHYTL